MSLSSRMESFSWENMAPVGAAVNNLSHQISGKKKRTLFAWEGQETERGKPGWTSLGYGDRDIESLPSVTLAIESAIESR